MGMITVTNVMDNEQIYRQYSKELTSYATGLVGPFDAPDVVTDACLKAFETRDWDQVANRRAYLYRTVLNMAHDHHRQTLSRRLREIKAAGAEATQAVEVDVDVLMAVERLSVRQRAAVFLTYWEDLSPNEVAERMGVTPGAVKRHLARARKRLAELLS
jgi:RNA polymerase sigma factor (sigma-70 family)